MKTNRQFLLLTVVLLCLLPVFVIRASAQQTTTPQPQAKVAQAPPEQPIVRRGTIKGRVLGDDGQPLAEVPVLASPIGRNAAARRPGPGGPAGAPSQTTTDEEGNFTFENLTPASYSISATVPGYIAPPAEEDSGAGIYHLGDLANITLVKGGVITGKIVNASGDILVGVSVSAIRTGNINGEPDEDLVPQGQGPGQGFGRTWRTDDRGVYRIYGLIPGTYIVQAGPPANGPGGFGPNFPSQYSGDAPTYYPSTVRDAAMLVAIQAGMEVSGIDIRYRGEKGHAVSGKILAKADGNTNSFANGPGATIISLSLPGTDNVVATGIQMNGGPGGGGRFNRLSDGGFALYGVPDGEYEISARRSGFGLDSDAVAAPHRISVQGTDVGGLQLTLAPLASLSGRVLMERRPGICPLPRRAFMEEVLLNTERDEATAQASAPALLNGRIRPSAPLASGEFILRNLEAGRWRIAAQLPDENWYLRAIMAETKPAATATRRAATPVAPTLANAARTGFILKSGEKQTGVLVAVTEGAAAIKGKVVSESGKAVGKVRVHLLPAEKEAADDLVRYAEAHTANDGSFQFKNLAPGRYLLLSKPIKPQSNATVRPLAWDNAQRAALRKEAEATGNIIELKTCQRLGDYKLNLK